MRRTAYSAQRNRTLIDDAMTMPSYTPQQPSAVPRFPTLDAAARIAAVVLNWNGCADTLACLASLQAQTARTTIYVVDNGSIDGSVDAVRANFPDVTILENGANLGYAGGNNVGIRRALDDGADVIVILNNDTLLEPECIARLTDALTPTDVAAAAPKTISGADPRIIQFAGGGISEYGAPFYFGLGCTDDSNFDRPHDTEWITGSAIAVRRSAFERIGAFDERFFLLFEDTDWSLRARRAGMRLRYCPTARVRHAGSVSFGGRSSSKYEYYRTRNHLLWLEKHYPLPLRWKLAVRNIIDAWRRADRLSKTPTDRSRLRRAATLGVLHYVIRRFGVGPF